MDCQNFSNTTDGCNRKRSKDGNREEQIGIEFGKAGADLGFENGGAQGVSSVF